MRLTAGSSRPALLPELTSTSIADCLPQIVAVTDLVESGSAVNLVVRDETGRARAVIANVVSGACRVLKRRHGRWRQEGG